MIKNSDVGYFIEADIEYPKHLHSLHSDLLFLPERMNINGRKKLACNLYDKKVHRVIKCNQRGWLKEYIDTNSELRKNARNDFEKDFFKLMNNAVFGKTMENVKKHWDIKLVNTDAERNK